MWFSYLIFFFSSRRRHTRCALVTGSSDVGSSDLLVMESIAVRGAWVEKEQGLINIVVFETGASSRICTYLKPGDPIVLMGPTGSPTQIPRHEKDRRSVV